MLGCFNYAGSHRVRVVVFVTGILESLSLARRFGVVYQKVTIVARVTRRPIELGMTRSSVTVYLEVRGMLT